MIDSAIRKRGVLEQTRNALLITDPERLINYGRVVTAGFAIIAIHLDPTQPSVFRTESRHILAFYALLATFLLVFPIRRPVAHPAHLVIHLIDTAVLGWLAFLTNELTSPFFSFLPFTLMAMTVRWGLHGAIAGALLLEVMLLAIGIPDILDGESELNFLIMRATYFLVAATMLGYFGAYREGSQARLTHLANWPLDSAVIDKSGWLTRLCGHAAEVIGCDNLIVVWRDQDEPVGSLAEWSRGVLRVIDLADDGASGDRWQAIDRDVLAATPSTGARLLEPVERGLLAKGFAPYITSPSISMTLGVLAGFSGLRFRGAVYLTDPDCRPEDAILLTEIIATRIGSEIDRLDLISRIANAARVEERSRLARDLHDSILQDLTATALKLRSASIGAPEAAPQLREIETLVIEQQRRIRRFVEDQREGGIEAPVDMCADLQRHAEILEMKWGIAIAFVWIGPRIHPGRIFVEEIVQLVSEATANAVRHGAASALTIRARVFRQSLQVDVIDNGAGLAIGSGSGSSPTGSLSLRGRLIQLGGTMTLIERTPGLEVNMVIPIGNRRA